MKSKKKYEIIFKKFEEIKRKQNTQVKRDIKISQEISNTINLLTQSIDYPEDSQITITRS